MDGDGLWVTRSNCVVCQGKERRNEEKEVYRIYKIDRSVFEGVIHLSLRWKKG